MASRVQLKYERCHIGELFTRAIKTDGHSTWLSDERNMFSLFLCLVSAVSCSNSPSGMEWGITSGSPWTPYIDCYVDNQECDISADNLIHTYLGVSTYTECQLLCVAFTHFDKDGHPFPEGCLLFSSCKEQRACQNCTTGSSQTDGV